jgi:hypothetical protein
MHATRVMSASARVRLNPPFHVAERLFWAI